MTISHSTNQLTNQPTNQPTNKQTNNPIIDQPFNRPASRQHSSGVPLRPPLPNSSQLGSAQLTPPRLGSAQLSSVKQRGEAWRGAGGGVARRCRRLAAWRAFHRPSLEYSEIGTGASILEHKNIILVFCKVSCILEFLIHNPLRDP